MRWLIFKGLICGLLLLSSINLYAESRESDRRSYENRVKRYKENFSSLVPTHTRVHLYGDIGLVSLGLGWDYGKKSQWETSILLGVVPKYNSEEAKVTFTLRQAYIPWSMDVGRGFSVEPLMCGLQFNTVLNGEFWVKEPNKYPNSYYGFSTKVRGMIFLGQSVTYDIPEQKRSRNSAVSLYYELGSCELYVISAFTNKYLRPRDYLRFAFGIKFHIF